MVAGWDLAQVNVAKALKPIDFYFDFSSPYGYLASKRIDALAARHGREARWRPHLLGVAFRSTGQRPLTEQPMRGDYHRHDFARSARLAGVAFVIPEPFPFAAVPAARAFYWLQDRSPSEAKRFAAAVFDAAFGRGEDMGAPARVAALASLIGLDGPALAAAIERPEIKQRLHREVADAIARGVFGSPYIIVDGEPFWGNDRLGEVERWIETGGW